MIHLAGFFFAAVLAFFLTPLSIALARRFNVLDVPSARKVHRHSTPRWGGVALYLSFVSALGALWGLFPSFQALVLTRYPIFQNKQIIALEDLSAQLIGILVGLTIVVILGMIDDKKPVQALVKLLVQIIACYVVIDYGVRIRGMAIPFASHFLDFPIIVSQIISVFWILGFLNSINLADGLDGLAIGLAGIAAGTFFLVSLIQSDAGPTFVNKQLQLAGVLSVVLLGSCAGFLPWNFSPAKLFMGDSGSLFLGFLLATITIIGTLKKAAFLSLVVPIVVIALPVLDVSLSILRRYRSGKGIMEPDRKHLHHRLLDMGWTPREVVLLVYCLTLILSVIAVTLAALKFRG